MLFWVLGFMSFDVVVGLFAYLEFSAYWWEWLYVIVLVCFAFCGCALILGVWGKGWFGPDAG